MDLLEAVGGSRWPEQPLGLAVVGPVQRIDVVCTVCPQITPQRVSPLMNPGSRSSEIRTGKGQVGDVSERRL